MSLGYVGYCKKESENNATVFFAYSGADWNNTAQNKADETAYDGVLAIDKSVLNLQPSKPHKQTEYLDWVYEAIENETAVIIKECRNAFRCGGDIDYIALHLFYHIFEFLHENRILPDKEAFIQ